MTGTRDDSAWDSVWDGLPDLADLHLCLCGRDPDSGEVRAELARVIALALRFGLITGGCLRDVADAFDRLSAALRPDEARALDRLRAAVAETLEISGEDMSFGGVPEKWTTRLH